MYAFASRTLCIYNKQYQLDPYKKKTLHLMYIEKKTLNIDRIIIHLTLSIPLNLKIPSFSSKRLHSLVKKYDQLQLIL